MDRLKIKVFIVSTGLGRIRRGFESHTQECFEALSQDPSLDMTLVKGGGGTGGNEITLMNLSRESRMAKHLGRLLNRDSYVAEQVSFFLSLIPHLWSQKPDIIYFTDFSLGNLLWRWRRLTKQRYKLLYCNGAAMSPPFPFERWDHVHQVAPYYFQLAVLGGTPAIKQTVIPHGVRAAVGLQALTSPERDALRVRLGLPEKQPLVLSVAAVNYQKRIDYLIKEMAALNDSRPYVLVLGQQEQESQTIMELGKSLLGSDRFQVRTVASHEVADYYKVADAFVLASLREGFGRVLLEAMSYGLPCLAHDYEISRFILGDEGYLADLSQEGRLTDLLENILIETDSEVKRRRRHRRIYENFSWDSLRPDYVEMFRLCASG